MSEPTPSIETETKTAKLIRRILCWAALGLLLVTCVMAAIKKFGG